jgi:hypothetical protein
MRVAKMGYAQRVTKRDKNGRITSSFERVRIVVPDGLPLHLPPPYTGHKNLTKKVCTDREHAEWTARFLAMIDEAREWTTTQRELKELDGLSFEEVIRRGPASFPVIAKLDRKMDQIFGEPDWKKVTAVPVAFESMIPKWAKHTNAPKKGIQNMETKSGRFAHWLGHDDMARATFVNCRDYRDFLIEEGDLSATTILNHLKALKRLFGYAYENDYLPANHWQRVKYKAGDGEEREDFTPDERRLILTLAREAGPAIKWCNWLSSFQAARLSEILDAHTRDIVVEEGVPVMKIRRKYRSPDQRLKTKVSTRTVPLHSAVLAEGFLDYVGSVGDGPLFSRVSLDTYGGRAGKVSKPISKWLRNVVGITDPNKPFHSHRHTAVSYLRNTLTPEGHPAVKEDIERYLTGHAGKDVHARYGDQWIKTLKAAIEIIPNPLQLPAPR